MIQIVFSIEIILFSLVSVVHLPKIGRFIKQIGPRERLLVFAWSAMAIGQFQIFRHDQIVQSVGALDAGAFYQLGWMTISGLATLLLIMTARIPSRLWRTPVIAFFIYIFLAFASSVVSEAPLITIYRSAQILLDFCLLAVAYSELKRSRFPYLLIYISLFLLVILICLVALGAVVMPEQAFVLNEGVLGKSLRGIILGIHPNELGLMAAIALLVSFVCSFASDIRGSMKLFWLLFGLLSGTVLFLSQARTSLAGAAVASMLAGMVVKKLRWFSVLVFGVAVVVMSYYWLSGSDIGVEDDVQAYLRRGVSDEHLSTLSGRTELWRIGWEMFKDAPLLGHGFAAGVRYEGIDYGLRLGTNMHSAYMQVLVDLGFLGILAWVIFVAGMSLTVYRNFKFTRIHAKDDYIAIIALLVMVVILFRSVLGQVLVVHQFNLMIFLSLYVYSIVNLELSRDPPN